MGPECTVANFESMTPTHDVARHEAIELRVFVDALRSDFETSARARHIRLDSLVFSDRLEGDASLLRRLLIGILAAAVRRAPDGTNVCLVVSPREHFTEFRVADEGTSSRRDDSTIQFYRVVAEAHGARLSVAETSSGTTVCLAFPTGVETTVPRPPTKVPSRSGTFLRGNDFAPLPFTAPTTLLVVDDEPLIRSFIRRALNNRGYGVLEAGSAEDALEILKAKRATISLLLSDVGLPGASGAELVRRAHLLVPGLPAVLMSASNPAVLAQCGVIENDTYLLQKPFDISDLLAKIAHELPLGPLELASATSRV
jgi:CheY-like chemotaxis protein